jgi:hypothetical protein
VIAGLLLAAVAIRLSWHLLGVLALALGELVCALGHQTEIATRAVYSKRAALRAAMPPHPETTQAPTAP